MLPTIGIMIGIVGAMVGVYIITKMLWISGLEGDSKASTVTKIFCIIAIVASVSGIWYLYKLGSDLITSGQKF